MNDLIILIPGIGGSVLQKQGKQLWCPSLGGISRAIINQGFNMEHMVLDGDDFQVDDLGDGVKPIRIISDPMIIPGLIKIFDGYTKISEMITTYFDVTRASADDDVNDNLPANFFEFPYDWRRDNRVAARRLEQLVNRHLTQWRAHAHPTAQVIIIAHSMGGLVARYYLEMLGGWEKCKALITIGCPHRGSLKALNYLANGYRKFLIDLTEVLRSCTSLYQLLPIYKAVKDGEEYRRAAEMDIPGVKRQRAQAALAFHREIIDGVNAHRKDSSYLDNCYVSMPVVGTYQPTLQSAELVGNRLTTSKQLPGQVDELLWHGDGTVPYLSAVPHELSNAYRNSFFVESHGALQANRQVLGFVHDQLSDMQLVGIEYLLGAKASPLRKEQAAISMALDDLYFDDEPVTISARILVDGKDISVTERFREHMIALIATITPLDPRGQPVTLSMEQTGDLWRLHFDGLPPGGYRIELRTHKRGPLSPPAVHDLFQVAARQRP